MSRFLLIAAALVLLSGCAATVGLSAGFLFGGGSASYGFLSVSNETGRSTFIHVNSARYGPVYDGNTIILELRVGTYTVIDEFGQRRVVYVSRKSTVYIVFS